MTESAAFTQGIVSGLLSGWLVGPFYGANVVLAVVILRKLWLNRAYMISRSLILITILVVISCTCHAFIHLDDLIVGFTSSHNVGKLATLPSPAVGTSEYFMSVRWNYFASLYLYAFNSTCNNSFIVWRVYMLWGQNRYPAILLTLLHLAALAIVIACGIHTAQAHTLVDTPITAFYTSACALSMVVQVSGALLIGWRTIGTPQASGNDKKRVSVYLVIFYASVESGCLAFVTELVGMVFLYHDIPGGIVVVTVLCQVTGLSSLAIILREIFKAELQASAGFVNITSPLVLQMSAFTFHRHHTQRSLNSSENGGAHNAVMVAIERSQLEEDTAKASSNGFPLKL